MGETYVSESNPCGAWFRFRGMSVRWECQLLPEHIGYHIAQDGYQWSDETFRMIPKDLAEGYSPPPPENGEPPSLDVSLPS